MDAVPENERKRPEYSIREKAGFQEQSEFLTGKGSSTWQEP